MNPNKMYCQANKAVIEELDSRVTALEEGGGGTEYTAGDGIDIINDVISAQDWVGVIGEELAGCFDATETVGNYLTNKDMIILFSPFYWNNGAKYYNYVPKGTLFKNGSVLDSGGHNPQATGFTVNSSALYIERIMIKNVPTASSSKIAISQQRTTIDANGISIGGVSSDDVNQSTTPATGRNSIVFYIRKPSGS